jgi:putative oxidoreductase
MGSDKTVRLQGWGITVLRAVTGTAFMFSGAHKLSAYPLNSTAEQVSQLEIPLPSALALVVLLVELLCGLALVIGLFTRWFSVPLALGMLVDVVFFHWPSPFFSIVMDSSQPL